MLYLSRLSRPAGLAADSYMDFRHCGSPSSEAARLPDKRCAESADFHLNTRAEHRCNRMSNLNPKTLPRYQTTMALEAHRSTNRIPGSLGISSPLKISAISKNFYLAAASVVVILAKLAAFTSSQSVGYHPNLFFGFNPYLSPVYGYGLGLPYGAYSAGSPLKLSPYASPLLSGLPFAGSHSGSKLVSKIHAKAVLKKITPASFGTMLPIQSVKHKLHMFKHPEYSLSPDGLPYGYGKHYGAAVMPNNPYKSAYGDYYSSLGATSSTNKHYGHHQQSGVMSSTSHVAGDANLEAQASDMSAATTVALANKHHLIKPLVKIGAFLTTVALLSKKSAELPMKLSPSGMIMNGVDKFV